MSEEDPALNKQEEVVAAEVAGETEQIPAISEEQKAPKMKNTETTLPKKRGRKPKVVVPPSDDAEKQEEELKPKNDGDQAEIEEAPSKIKNETNEEDDEEYGGGDESDDDYNGNTYQKKKLSKKSSAKNSTGAKRGRKPKSQAQKDAEYAEKQASLAAASGASQVEQNDATKESEGSSVNPLQPKGKRVTRTSSGRLPSHLEVYQPTFKKYKPTKKEGEANNQPSEDSSAKEQQTIETNGKTETNNENGDALTQSAGGEESVNAKRPHSALEGTSPTNILTQAELPEEHHHHHPEKKLKTDSP